MCGESGVAKQGVDTQMTDLLSPTFISGSFDVDTMFGHEVGDLSGLGIFSFSDAFPFGSPLAPCPAISPGWPRQDARAAADFDFINGK